MWKFLLFPYLLFCTSPIVGSKLAFNENIWQNYPYKIDSNCWKFWHFRPVFVSALCCIVINKTDLILPSFLMLLFERCRLTMFIYDLLRFIFNCIFNNFVVVFASCGRTFVVVCLKFWRENFTFSDRFFSMRSMNFAPMHFVFKISNLTLAYVACCLRRAFALFLLCCCG